MSYSLVRRHLLALLVLLAGYTNGARAQDDVAREPLSIVFLLDGSASMQQNDPDRLWKSAAQIVIDELNAHDRVAVIQFDTDAELRTGGDNGWVRADERQQLAGVLNKIGNKGAFTDYRAGLLVAARAFKDAPAGGRRIIALLSDGVLDPNPRSDAYAPHHLAYLKDITGADRDERRQIRNRYRQMLAPIARRIIRNDLLPDLIDENVEVFTIALGPHADHQLMETIAESTSQRPEEIHHFSAQRATDLMDVFSSLLQYWTDNVMLAHREGNISIGTTDTVHIDQWVRNAEAVTFLDGDGKIFVRTPGGVSGQLADSSASLVYRHHLPSGGNASTWWYGFSSGSGEYRTLWIGENLLRINVDSLRQQYEYGDSVYARVYLTGREGRLMSQLMQQGRLVADIGTRDAAGLIAWAKRVDLKPGSRYHTFAYEPTVEGEYALRFTAYLRTDGGDEILPRPSILYRFGVRPRFYATPGRFDLGDVKRGDTITLAVQLHSGLGHPLAVSLRSEILHSSAGAYEKGETGRLPSVAPRVIPLGAGSVRAEEVALVIPKNADWGDYEGSISFIPDGTEPYHIAYSAHIPSFWESIRLGVFAVGVILALILAAMIYLWGFLDSPSGVLVFVESDGVRRLPIRLSYVRKNIFYKWFHWRRNRLLIAPQRGDITLKEMPSQMLVELKFYLKKTFLKNVSPDGSENSVVVKMKHINASKAVRPGRFKRLEHGSEIKLGNLRLRYERRFRR